MFYQLEHYGNSTAVIDDLGNVVSYEQLAYLADCWAKQLNDLSVQTSCKKLVLIRCRNHIAPIAAYLGCLRNGHVAMLIADTVATELLQNILDKYHPDFIYEPVAHDASSSLADSCYEKTADSSDKALSDQSLSSFIAASYYLRSYGNSEDSTKINPKLALLLSTSGSTGSPRMVRLSKNNLQSNAESIVSFLELNEQERPITTLPFNYSYGLSVINSHLEAGATILLTNKSVVDPQFWEFFNAYQATSLSGVPYTYELLKMLRLNRRSLPSLKTMTQSGAHMGSSLVHEFSDFCRKNGSRLIKMYGQTETTARMSYVPWDILPQKEESVGIAIPNGRFEIIDDQSQSITEPNVSGRLVYYGPNVSLGMANSREDLYAGDVNHGCIETGDIAYFDQDGYLFITGRSSRFLKLAGLRFSLQECENIIHNNGFECIAVGHDKCLCLALLTDGNSNMSPEEQVAVVHKLMVNTLHLHHSMFKIRAIASSQVPRNEYGKVLYQSLAEEYFA